MAKAGPPKPANEAEFHRVWAIVQELGVAERHFNEMESRYRALASTWLLAAFAGIGYIVVHRRLGVDLSVWIIVAIVAACGALGILLLWNLDLLVYHQLLDVCFEEGRKLEERYPWLPQTRSEMTRIMPGAGVLRRIVLFYIGGVDALLVLSSFALAMWISVFSAFLSFGIGVSALLLMVFIDRLMWIKSNSEVRVPSSGLGMLRQILHL